MNKQQEICKIVGIYAIFGGTWIYFSDTALAWFVRDPEIMTQMAIFKGLLFIITTSVLLYFLIARLSTKINQSTKALRESEERLHFLVKNSSDSLVILNADGSQRYVSPGAERITGFPIEKLEGKTLDALIHPDDMQAIEAAWNEAVEHPEKTVTVQYRHIHKTREWVFSEAIAQSFLNVPSINGVIASVRDITERKKAEEEKNKLQMQLTQSQKMESVGRLAGGIAHDFNNMLTVILGHTEMALDRLDPSLPLHANLQDIRKAAERSAFLTQQLLAFARQQTVAPKVLDLNRIVDEMLKILRPLIGEHIDLAWLPGKNPGQVKMDPSQIDQILANLCVNARDAIGDAGTITIETNTVTLNEADAALHSAVPGEYMLLSVSDNGCGMDAETLSHLFEPFFTTKELGKGTGLGLATIYGIVKQNNGCIEVASKPGQGAVFKIYLPRHLAESDPAEGMDAKKPEGLGHKTILLVEDEPMILEMTETMLKELGYSVLAASTPGQALHLAREHAGAISLLITDVVMPEMNGRTLAKNLLSLHPGLKRLFMSGYTANVIAHQGVLDEEVHFIQKPFTIKNLAGKVKEALDQDPV